MIDRRQFLKTCSVSAVAVFHERSGRAADAGPNEVIEQARLLGMEVLKPSDRDLQYGLALHAKSIVFDVYGFSPNAAVDGDRLADAVRAGASDLELQDLEEDMRMTRYVTDDVIKAIVDGGGLIGICAIPHFLGRTGDIAALLDHVDYVVKKFGIDHVGIGTDIGYRSRNDAVELKKVPPRSKRRGRYESFWPEEAFLSGAEADKRYPKSKSLAWTNWPLLTVGLVQRGYSDEQVEKVLGLNMLRIARANLGL